MRGGFRGSDTRSNSVRPNGGDRGGFNGGRRGEVYNRRDDYIDRRDGDYHARGGYDDGFDTRQRASRGRGYKKASKPWRKGKGKVKRFGDDRQVDGDLSPTAAAADTRQPTDAPAIEQHRPASPDAAGQRTLMTALDLARSVRAQSGGWRLGATRALSTERAPSSRTLYEAVRIAEEVSVAKLAHIIEAALFREATETHALLTDYRDEMAKSAPPAAVSAPAPAPAPAPATAPAPFVLDAATIALIGNQIVAQLKQ
jgi:hypothetical protein